MEDGYELTWDGRELVAFRQCSDFDSLTYVSNITYTYNADGIRTSKTVNGIKHEYYLSGIIWMIFGHLKRYESGVPHGTDHLKIAVSLMSSENKFKINTIARVLHISRVHLTRLFKEKYGVSPGRFYLRLRMTQAAELLSAGHSVANVASSIGFKDPFVFSRAFKRYYNCSPTEYIKQQNALSNKNASHK